MKRSSLAILIFLAIGGLIFIQFRLLMVGVRLEKQRFDHRIERALQNTVFAMDEDEKLASQLGQFLATGNTSAPMELVHEIDTTVSRELKKEGIRAAVNFAITDFFARRVYLSSGAYEEESFNFGRYTMRLGPAVDKWCNDAALSPELSCNRALHLDVPSLFTYLLGELDYLLWPSLACLVVIIFGLFLLINTLRREEQLNKIKNEFINNLTHELKTPAFSISLSSKMAMEKLAEGDEEKVKKYLSVIQQENEKMKVQVEKVLELASLQSGRYRLNRSLLNPLQIIKEVVAEYDVESGSVQLELPLLGQIPVLTIDEAHFKNVLRNLIDNAIKYAGGPVQVKVVTESEKEFFKITVEDNGPGIPPEHQRAVFDKFYRVPQTGGHQVKGFGLGLSYVKQVVQAHGGKVSLKSSPGRGTRVTTYWPVT